MGRDDIPAAFVGVLTVIVTAVFMTIPLSCEADREQIILPPLGTTVPMKPPAPSPPHTP